MGIKNEGIKVSVRRIFANRRCRENGIRNARALKMANGDNGEGAEGGGTISGPKPGERDSQRRAVEREKRVCRKITTTVDFTPR